jgi:hypothetical protein
MQHAYSGCNRAEAFDFEAGWLDASKSLVRQGHVDAAIEHLMPVKMKLFPWLKIGCL